MEREESTQKFQLLAKIYEVLKDADLREIYDKSGISFSLSIYDLTSILKIHSLTPIISFSPFFGLWEYGYDLWFI